MYTEFYGLRELPFSLTPDPRFLYFTPSHKEVLANLRYGITNGKGLIVVTGEVGTGKTTIVRWMLEHFDRTVLVAYIFNPRLTVNEFYQHVAQLLNIQNWSTKSDLMLELGRTLEARSARGLRTVLIIDEAQGLAPFVLEEIRLLMNFESNTAKFLQIILTGQPELREVLNSQELRQLKQRIALRSEIQPLPNVSETENYIMERLRVAGAKEPNIFSPEAIDFIFRCSEGIPRQVNNLCDNAMLLGYGAELPIIGRKVIEEVAETFDMLPRKDRSVLEAEYDQPAIFTREARDRMTDERVEMPAPRLVVEAPAAKPFGEPPVTKRVVDPAPAPKLVVEAPTAKPVGEPPVAKRDVESAPAPKPVTEPPSPKLVVDPAPAPKLVVEPPVRRLEPMLAEDPLSLPEAPSSPTMLRMPVVAPPARPNGHGQVATQPRPVGNGVASGNGNGNGSGASKPAAMVNGNGLAAHPPVANGNGNGNGTANRPSAVNGNGSPRPMPTAIASHPTAEVRGNGSAVVRPEPGPAAAVRPRERVGKRH